jgi:NifU-like protein
MQCTPDLAQKHFFNPANVGDATEPNFVGRAASFECGATLRISLHVDDSQRIVEAKFKAAGCSVMVAAASLLADQIKWKTTGDAATLAQYAELFQEQLGEVAAERRDCAALASEALIAAISEYSDSVRTEWTGDEALICTCFGVSERTIEHEVETKGLKTIAEVTRACKAGAGCGSCYHLIEDILRVNGES